MFDSHCHLDRSASDPNDALVRALNAGIKYLLIAGVNPEQWCSAQSWIQPGVFMSAGLHPWWVSSHPETVDQGMADLEAFVTQRRAQVHAIGETGLDFRRSADPLIRQAQRRAFQWHIDAACRWDLPLILHIVGAHTDALGILRNVELPVRGGVVHGFSGSAEIAMQYNRLGLSISFSGAVTHPNRRRLHRAAAAIPDEWLLVETDSPDQTPWNRHPAPNEPAFLIDVLSTMATLRHQSLEEVTRITTSNALRLFAPHERRHLQIAPTI